MKFDTDREIAINTLKQNVRPFYELSEEEKQTLEEADRDSKVEALVNHKWYIKVNCRFAEDGIYRIMFGYK